MILQMFWVKLERAGYSPNQPCPDSNMGKVGVTNNGTAEIYSMVIS